MGRHNNYAIIQIGAHPARGERLNVGIVVFNQHTIDVRPSKRLEKVHALSAALDVDSVRESIMNLSELDSVCVDHGSRTVEERLGRLGSIAPFVFSNLGSFDSPNTIEYENAIASLLQKLVDPEPAPMKNVKARTSSLLKNLKLAFRQERVLARKGEDLSSHRIVPNHKIAEGLSADLVLRNGALHVFETVDASAIEVSPRKIVSDIAVSALIFERARMTFGESGTTTQLIYQASPAAEALITPSLQAAEHQGAKLINWESMDDRRKLVTYFSALATPLEKPSRSARSAFFHASSQQKSLLN